MADQGEVVLEEFAEQLDELAMTWFGSHGITKNFEKLTLKLKLQALNREMSSRKSKVTYFTLVEDIEAIGGRPLLRFLRDHLPVMDVVVSALAHTDPGDDPHWDEEFALRAALQQIYETQTATGSGYGETRYGARGELWWVDVATKMAAPLTKLNGVGYLPTKANGHIADATVNYEPTVNPVVSGGYAWVIFTSRRLYGNVATRGPFESDPREFDLTSDPTPKKLWVAAIDLNAAPGTDPSHPAFYLPAQELLAGNARGYWVVDPCKSDSTSCETGDECCGGYCRAAGDGGALVCSSAVPTCAQEFENCATSANCCNGLQCVNGRCAASGPTQTN